jgi:Uma2 family endonuclease
MQSIAIHTESANLTEEQFFKLCSENKELRLERDANKNIIVMSPTGFSVSNFESKIFGLIMVWNEANKLGYVTGPIGGYLLPNGAMRAPDVAWTTKSRIDSLSEIEKQGFPKLCPNFIIEVLSASDNLNQTKEKMQEWISNGCRLAWLIDLENKMCYIYKLATETKQQTFSETLSGENVLEGFELKLNEILI